ncbi:MAG: alginate export family protein [Labilithrix sp.]|nr:alginate export family protein [Labilithrix sp.]
MTRARRALVVAGLLAAAARDAHAADGPWSDDDPVDGPSRIAVGEAGLRAAAEYRANAIAIRPITTASTDRQLARLEHRLRLDGAIDHREKVRVVASVDAFDDASVAASIAIRRLYGEARLPFGVLRVGRQAYDRGAGVLVNDGDGRRNRFGVAYRGDNVDRVLFATKPIELFGPEATRDDAPDRGAFAFLAYDRVATGQPQLFSDDAHQVVSAIALRAPQLRLVRDLDVRAFHAYRWQTSRDTHVHAAGGRVAYGYRELHVGLDAAALAGTTEARSVRQVGLRAAIRWDRPKWSAYAEVDYASGPDRLRPGVGGSALSRFSFAEDTNVGLLLFEHVLAQQSLRSEPTRGAFTNAFALFPQLDLRPLPSLLLRGGVLLAWAPSPIVDEVRTLERRARGVPDPEVNLVGGRPARTYGTELDARIQWRFLDHAALDLEGAVLLPGAALEDAEGRAPRAAMVQGRATVFF